MPKMLHTCVRVKNLEESLAFYQEAFGFKETRRKDYAEHVAKGYDVTELKGLPGNPANYYFVKDPDGYKIEIIREK